MVGSYWVTDIDPISILTMYWDGLALSGLNWCFLKILGFLNHSGMFLSILSQVIFKRHNLFQFKRWKWLNKKLFSDRVLYYFVELNRFFFLEDWQGILHKVYMGMTSIWWRDMSKSRWDNRILTHQKQIFLLPVLQNSSLTFVLFYQCKTISTEKWKYFVEIKRTVIFCLKLYVTRHL